MIPVRVKLEGFMSYREPTEFWFDGAPLWMLSGPNGAGKSSVFDAITFALYGLHRGGKQDSEELINHDADNLLVEFDFRKGPDSYRVRRTVPRQGRKTFQAFRLADPAAPTLRESGIEAIPDTEYKTGLDAWVLRTIGLDEEAFTTCVLLQQGKSERLINAKNSERHEILSQLVNLARYERLRERADRRYKDYQRQVALQDRELAGIPTVDDATIKQLTIDRDTALAVTEAAQLREVALARVHEQSKRWETLQEEQRALQPQIESDQALITAARAIEQQAARYEELAGVLPRLKQVLEIKAHQAEIQRALAETEHRAQNCREQAAQAEDRWHRAVEQLGTLQATHTQCVAQLEIAQDTIEQLTGTWHELEESQKIASQLAELDRQLAAFPADLDVQVDQQSDIVSRLEILKDALPWIKQFAAARQTWHEANTRCAEAMAKQTHLTEELTAATTEYAQAETIGRQLNAQVEQCKAAVTEATTLLNEAKRHLTNFQKIEHTPTCSYCGQALTPNHIEQERVRLEAAQQTAQTQFAEARSVVQAATKAQESHQADLQVLQATLERCQHGLIQTKADNTAAEKDRARAETQGRQALAELPPSYQSQIGEWGADMGQVFATPYPSASDLKSFDEQVNQQKHEKQTLVALQKQKQARAEFLAQRMQPAQRHAMLQTLYPADRTEQVRAAFGTAEKQRDQARTELSALKSKLTAAQTAVEDARKVVEGANGEQQELDGQMREYTVRQQESSKQIANMTELLPDPWLADAANISATAVGDWCSEMDSLADTYQRREALYEAQHEAANRQKRLAAINTEIAALPLEAQRPAHSVTADQDQARQAHKEAEDLQHRAINALDIALGHQQRRTKLATERQEAVRQAEAHRTLAQLLDREHLQRHLLRGAEEAIVEHASAILDRLSSGTLRVELAAGEKADKQALDLVAYDADTGSKPLPVHQLSGGQRFRVAISLALGLGAYTSRDGGGIESVIIDEGFGGLDKRGLSDIIEELHELRDQAVLQRIILVSHQDEFAQSFANGYSIRLEGGTSRVSLRGSE